MTESDALSHASAAHIGRLLAGGSADPVEVTEFFLDRIEKTTAKHIFLTVTANRARREAEASRSRYRAGRTLGPLDGVPLTWKDLFDIAGTTTTAGSALFRDAPPAKRDAPVVAHLAAAGMVCLGKVALPEFAFSGLGLNPHYGTPVNPHDTKVARAPGGSSSGSAVSVARGLCPCSIGSDTGGSVRIPASLNGIVGFKPSEGRIDKTAVFPLSESLDTVGPLTRTVEDAILLDMAMQGLLTTGVRRADLSALTIVVPESVVMDDLDDAVGANFEAALERLSRAGAKVVRRKMPLLKEVQATIATHGSLAAAEAYHFHKDRVDGPDCEKIDRRVSSRILAGKQISSFDLITTMHARQRLTAELGRELGDGLLAMPTTAHTAPEIAPLEADDDVFHRTNLKTLRNTILGNFLAMCGLALPSGRDANGLPTSILFSALSGADEMLLSYGLAIESALGEAAR